MYRRQYHNVPDSSSTKSTLSYDEENEEMTLADMYDGPNRSTGIIDYERDNQAYNTVMRNELLHHIDNLMRQQLTEDEQSIVERYFGIGCIAHRPSHIAEDFGISTRKVTAIVNDAIRKLRECDYAIYLYQYLHGKRI
jgi:DNA-directed RNA polymerase sigma subunit (sigma70/sigma32)